MKKMQRKNTVLEKLGFTTEESSIYLSLLETGPASISDIVRKVGLHRPTVYKMLPALIDRGLVSVMPKGKYKVYVAESPEKVERLFTELEDDFNSEIHAMHESYSTRGKKPLVTFSEGDKAIRETFSDVVHSLKKDDVYYRYSSALSLARKKFLPKDYRYQRDFKGLERYVITDEASRRNTTIKKLGKKIKFIPNDQDLFGLNVSQIIYGNKVAIIDYNSKTVVTIDNPMIAEFQKRVFKLLYAKL